MTTDFPTAPPALGHKGAGGGTVEKSLSASHTEILTSPSALSDPVVLRLLTQRTDSLLLSFHGLLLSEIEAILPRFQHRQLPAVANHFPSRTPY